MRARTLLAGTVLALLTALGSAHSALAADNGTDDAGQQQQQQQQQLEQQRQLQELEQQRQQQQQLEQQRQQQELEQQRQQQQELERQRELEQQQQQQQQEQQQEQQRQQQELEQKKQQEQQQQQEQQRQQQELEQKKQQQEQQQEQQQRQQQQELEQQQRQQELERQKQQQQTVPPPTAQLTLSKSDVEPGGTFGVSANCVGGAGSVSASRDVTFAGSTGRVSDYAGVGSIIVILTCYNSGGSSQATSNIMVLPKVQNESSLLPDFVSRQDHEAHLSILPNEAYPGDRIWADARCPSGYGTLSAPEVRFNDHTGRVDDDAREGRIVVTLSCSNGDSATDFFRVARKYDGHAFLNLSSHAGFRREEVQVVANCATGDSARFESNVLDDVTLYRDGDRLRGITHVGRNADFGRGGAVLRCENGDRPADGFYVLDQDHQRFLDLRPGFGHRGDQVDVHVGCDRPAGRLDSDALDSIDLDRSGDRDWRYDGTTHVRADAEPGEHTVRVHCGDNTLEQSFFVQGGDGGSPGGGDQTSVYPRGGVETGGGPVASDPIVTAAQGPTALSVTVLSTAAAMVGASFVAAGAVAQRRGGGDELATKRDPRSAVGVGGSSSGGGVQYGAALSRTE